MKNKSFILFVVMVILLTMCSGCGNKSISIEEENHEIMEDIAAKNVEEQSEQIEQTDDEVIEVKDTDSQKDEVVSEILEAEGEKQADEVIETPVKEESVEETPLVEPEQPVESEPTIAPEPPVEEPIVYDTNADVYFETVDLDGNRVNTAELFHKHKVNMVNIWANWCGPCVSELADIQAIADDFASQDVGIYGLVIDIDSDRELNKAKEILADRNVTYMSMVSNEDIDKIFNIQYIPMTIFVDEKGNYIAETIVGANTQ